MIYCHHQIGYGYGEQHHSKTSQKSSPKLYHCSYYPMGLLHYAGFEAVIFAFEKKRLQKQIEETSGLRRLR